MMHQLLDGAACEQAKVNQHLVVARASAVNLLAHVAKPLCEQQFHLAVHIFNAFFNGKLARLNFGVDVSQLGSEHRQFIGCEQPNAFEHSDVSQRAKHIVACQVHIHFAVTPHGVAFNIVVHRNRFFP